MPDDLRTQIERIEEVVQAFNIPVLALEGYEADDVIGSVVRLLGGQEIAIRIITGDRDILQLLSEQVSVQRCPNAARRTSCGTWRISARTTVWSPGSWSS